MPDVPGLEVPEACRLRVKPDGLGTPSDWIAYTNESPGGTLADNVQTLDGDTAYIKSNGVNSAQWYTLEDPTPLDGSPDIVRVTVRLCVKSDGFYVSSARISLGIGADTIGGIGHPIFPHWTIISESFDLTPGAMPAAFTWPDINNVEIGVTSLTVGGEVRCTAAWLLVDTCTFSACPRCCCCCLCFAPTMRIPENAFTYDVGGAADLSCPALTLSMPFCGFYPDGGCWFQYGAELGDCAPDFEPVPVGVAVVGGDGHSYQLQLIGASMVGSVLNPEGNCSLIQFVFGVHDNTDNVTINTVTLGPVQTTLTQCEPYHESSVAVTGNLTPATDPPITSTDGSVTIDCGA